MSQRLRGSRRLSALAIFALFSSGCANSQFSMPPGMQALRQPPTPQTAQLRELNARAGSLDATNQHLHAELAQQQQHTLQLQKALQKSQQELAEVRRRNDGGGGSSDVAGRGTSARNASYGGALPLVKIPGAEVLPDGDLVRIRLESSQLFAPGKAELKPEVAATVDRLAQVLRGEYAGRLVEIEGHTDSDPITRSKWKNNHELAVARSLALFAALKSRGVSESQLVVAGYGPNRPLAGDKSKQGKSQNRRVELVIHPERAGA